MSKRRCVQCGDQIELDDETWTTDARGHAYHAGCIRDALARARKETDATPSGASSSRERQLEAALRGLIDDFGFVRCEHPNVRCAEYAVATVYTGEDWVPTCRAHLGARPDLPQRELCYGRALETALRTLARSA